MAFSLYRNSALIWFSNALVKPLWILWVDRSIQNMAGPEAYGAYYQWFNLSLLLAVLLDGGMANYLNQRSATGNLEEAEWRHLLRVKGYLFLAYLVGTVGLALALDFPRSAWPWTAVMAVMQGFSFLNLFLRARLAGQQQFVAEGLLGAADKAVMVALSLPLLKGNAYLTGDCIQDFTLIQLIGVVTITFATTAWIYRTGNPLKPMSGSPRLASSTLSENSSSSWYLALAPYFVLGFIMTLYYRLDVVLLRLWGSGSLQETGWYAASYRLLDAGMMIPLLLGQMWVGRFAFLQNQMPACLHLLNQSVRIPLILGLGGLLWLGPYAADWIAWWYPGADSIPADKVGLFAPDRILFWHLAAYLPFGTNVVLGSLLTAHQRFNFLIPLHLAALLVHLGCLFWWIPDLGAVGAARACCVTQGLVLLGQVAYCIKVYSWNPWRLHGGYLSLLMVLALIPPALGALTEIRFQFWQHFLVGGGLFSGYLVLKYGRKGLKGLA